VSGQRSRRLAENDRLREWRGAELMEASVDSAATMVGRYGRAVVAAERTRFLETIVEISRQEASLYGARLAAADVTVRDAKLAGVDLSRNRMALGAARSDLARALADVARLLGGPLELAPPVADMPSPSGPWELAAREPQRILDQNPRLLALSREAEYFRTQAARESVEGHAPLNLILSAGEGADGSARLGGGLAWTFPLLRRNQGEQARAFAERERALDVADGLRRELLAALRGLVEERTQVRRALEELKEHGEPDAEAALEAARSTERAGKGDLLHVVSARRDLVSVRASGLDLEQREWSLLAELVSMSGRIP
jgi:cobalt-zinc-cadmium efflux system outer membrane protein